MKIGETECSETSVHKIHTPESHPKERIQHSEKGEILKPRIDVLLVSKMCRDFPPQPDQNNEIIFDLLLTLCFRYYFIYRVYVSLLL